MSLAFKSDSDVLIDGMKTAGVGDYFITSLEKYCDRTRLCVSEKVLAKCLLAGIERSGEDWWLMKNCEQSEDDMFSQFNDDSEQLIDKIFGQ